MVNVPRLSYAMAVERDLPPLLGRVHPRFHTPHVSVLVFATLVWLLAASGSFLQNLTLSAVSRLFTYGVVCAAMIACRRRRGATGRAARSPRELPAAGREDLQFLVSRAPRSSPPAWPGRSCWCWPPRPSSPPSTGPGPPARAR